MKKFLACVLFPNSYRSAQKVDSFRQRFDFKYKHNPFLHIPLLPAIEVEPSKANDLIDRVSEVIEGHSYGDNLDESFDFNQLEVLSAKKFHLFLRASFSSNWDFVVESLDEMFSENSQHYFQNQHKNQKRKQSFLSLGRFHQSEELHQALSVAQEELELPLSLNPESIYLFEKTNFQWRPFQKIYEFSDSGLEFMRHRAVNF